ncbi:regulator of nonsense transcripts 3A isoform X2 [Diceros bicornis minor]|uniref:regulator of nonsense transcripts 3A isoform X2 n=1 Tax=Diceros bicornis minor TaxID=77932 RepID=UPI0026EBAC01|nr:regulator of nonsense transcripts 3A isoform X2 [Diceros bicornis minor]
MQEREERVLFCSSGTDRTCRGSNEMIPRKRGYAQAFLTPRIPFKLFSPHYPFDSYVLQVVIRRLPPSLTKEQLEQQLRPLPAHDSFEFFTADLSLYPHLYSRAYINFRNPDDILLFRDRFDGYIFIDSKGLEYPAVVEFAPFQKIVKNKLKKKDAKTGSIEDDPEYKKFLETYCVEEEKTSANPETLLGDIEAKTRELIGTLLQLPDVPVVPPFLSASALCAASPSGPVRPTAVSCRTGRMHWIIHLLVCPSPSPRRTTPLLEYIKNRKLEKQRIREEKREERRRRELEKKRLREEEKRKRREEERCKRKEADKQERMAEREVRIKLLKKPEKGEEPTPEKPKEREEEVDAGDGRWEPCPRCAVVRPRPPESSREELRERSQNDSDKEQRDVERRFREKDLETQRQHLDDSRKHRAHYELDKISRKKEEEPKWGEGFTPDRGQKGSQDGGVAMEAAERPVTEQSAGGPAPRKEHVGNKDRPSLQLYHPGARSRARECGGRASEEGRDGRRAEAEDSTGAGSKKSKEAE